MKNSIYTIAVFTILLTTTGNVLSAVYRAPVVDDHTTILRTPDGVDVIRGILIHGNGWNGSSQAVIWTDEWVEFAKCHGFALMGTTDYYNIMPEEIENLDIDLAWYATAANQPSLVHAPIVFTGHSNGGQMAYDFNACAPERTIAFSANKGGFYTYTDAPLAACKTPGMIFAGEKDSGYRITGTMALFDTNRPKYALYSWAVEDDMYHEVGNTWGALFMFFDHAIRARYPVGVTPLNGPVTLLDLNETDGWLCNKPSLANGLIGDVYSYTNYPGTPTNACWLLDKDVAYLYKGLATYKPHLSFSMDPAPVVGHHQEVTITCTDPWMTTADVFDGSVKLGTITKGGPTSISAILPSGGHGIVLRGYDAQGNERTSVPTHLVVKYYDGIDVIGNGLLIPSGDMDPRSLDGTQMEPVEVSSGPVSQTFTIQNHTHGKTIHLMNTPNRVSIQGGGGQFTVFQDAGSSSLGPNESTTFTIQFDPSSAGIHRATISIQFDDALSPDYRFDVVGAGYQTPVVSNDSATSISSRSAEFNGTISPETGLADVTVYWGTTDGGTTPTSWENSTFLPAVTGAFSTVSSLIPSTGYYYRAYATNGAGEAWAPSSASFTTIDAAPVFNSTALPEAVAISEYHCSLLDSGIVTDDDLPYDSLSFSKVGGADWINVTTNGILTGTPSYADFAIGTQTVTLAVADQYAHMTQQILTVVVVSSALSQLPFQDTFETFSDGDLLAGVNNWVSLRSSYQAYVAATDYSTLYWGEYPAPGDPHEKVADLGEDATVVQPFWNTETHSKVWIDGVYQLSRADDLDAFYMSANPPAQMAAAVSAGGHLAVYHAVDSGSYSNVWTELPQTSIADQEWVRLIVNMSYTNSAQNRSFFNITLNDSGLLTSPAAYQNVDDPGPSSSGTWFLCANQQSMEHHLSRLVIKSTVCDDVTVNTNPTVYGGLRDTDDDLMPDEWEYLHGLNLSDPSDANKDLDEDGQINLHEYLAGMDPESSQSLFAFATSELTAANFNVSWYSAPGKYYRLESCDNLTDGLWFPVASHIPATPPVNTATVSQGNDSALFLRIILE